VNVVNDQSVKTVIAKKDIADIRPSAISLMPEKLLDTLNDSQIADLFAYLMTDSPKSTSGVQGASESRLPGGKQTKKLKVCLVSGSFEYKSDDSLAAFQKFLESNYSIECLRAFAKAERDQAFAGLENLEKCDVAIFFTRRLRIEGAALKQVKAFVESRKPIIGIRTASHGFQNWLEMDKEVLGGDYKNHFGHDQRPDIKLTEAGQKHPVLTGVKPFQATGGLYKNPNVAKDVTVLMTGEIPKEKEPVTWVREHKGGRVFYTSLGHPDDFKDENFTRMLTNAIFWTAKKDVPVK
jgi:type 1 glutamine amidotransferase